MTGRTMIKSAGMVTVLLFLSRLFGFAREATIAARYGTSWLTDTYFAAASVPGILFLAFNDAIKTAFIPVYGDYHDKEEGNSLALAVFLLLGGLLLAGSVLLVIFAPLVMRLVVPGYTGAQYELSVTMARIMLPGLLFLGLSGLCSGVLHIKKNFFVPSLTAFPNNLVIIVSALLLGVRYGIMALVWATAAGFALQFLIQLPAVARHGIFAARTIAWHHPAIKRMGVLLLPVLIGSATVELKTLIDKVFGSFLAEQSISYLNYAVKIYSLPNGILILALLTVLYPTMVELYYQRKMKEFKETVRQGTGLMIVLMFPIMVGMMVLSTPIVRLIYERAAFDTTATHNTAYALIFYSLGLLPSGVMLLFNRAFYATKDTKTPMYFSFLTTLLNVVLNWLLMKPLAYGGLALGTSLSFYLGVIAMAAALRRKVGPFGLSLLLDTLWKTGVASLLMGVAVWFALPYLAGGGFLLQALRLGSVIALGALVYFVLAYLLKIRELDLAFSLLRRRLGRG
ncbi:MAG TPA: murein biosynthesis integral membrane protein MurJ [Firmicutes bacterium]|nr:murein biosynthesis integral membrane protein MurJ [Bacillota bacterium]